MADVTKAASYTLAEGEGSLTLSGSGNINGTGNATDNTINGNKGNNILSGGGGVDVLIGGAGNDTYIYDSTDVTITESEAGGIDTVKASLSYTLGDNLENLTLTGSDNLIGAGNALNNIITGNAGNNTLSGGGGTDTLIGGAGDDVYVYDNAGIKIVEGKDGGNDTVNASLSYTLAANVENLVLSGADALVGAGNASNNIITGSELGNTLSGGGGTDTLIGGAGDDTYIYDNKNITITEDADAGVDTVISSLSYTLGANLDNLTLKSGKLNIAGTGNELNNIITGNDGKNTLAGGGGTDTLIGGAGDDTYVYDATTITITESEKAGTDTVLASIDYSLGTNLENLTLTGTSNLAGIGNASNNTITGNDGNNTLAGGGGTDTLKGELGDDSYIYDSTSVKIVEAKNAGSDTVYATINYTLGDNLENMVLLDFIPSNAETPETVGAINGTGNKLDNTIIGNSSANTLMGGGGTDVLIGGAGDDTYIYDAKTITITESEESGTDTVIASLNYTLDANVENLVLKTGTTALAGTGNELNNIITGNAGKNSLSGGGGTDTLIGGLGDDTYIVDSNDITIVETNSKNSGTDIVLASVDYTLADNVENLTLTGTTALTGAGNAGNNIVKGNDLDNTLSGGGGTDTLVGGLGNDTYIYDGSKLTFTEAKDSGTDTVLASASYTLVAKSNIENLTLTGTSNINGTGNELNNVITGNDGNNTLAGGGGSDTLAGGLGNDTYIYDKAGIVITESSDGGTDTVLASVNYSLDANVENVTLTGKTNISAIGNALDNVITGNDGNNSLAGGGGSDTLIGGLGDDTYIYDSADITIVETSTKGSGTDTVLASLDYTLAANVENLTLTGTTAITGAGNALNNLIKGNDLGNTLSGGGGTDTLAGGLGDDTYIYDNTGVKIVETAGGGTDLVLASLTYSLVDNVENLTLSGSANISGTGNKANNLITGNDGDNTLAGGGGTDTLIGLSGNDTYIYDSAGLTITETAGGGTDTVLASLSYTVDANVENLTLTGSSAINGTGNSLNNIITGNIKANTLSGGGGTDTLIGGLGDDTYIYDSANITITETSTAGSGNDTVLASIDYTLAANVENLTLTGTTALTGAGNALNNIITGNAQDNTLSGGGGSDSLIGGLGNDTYIYDNAKVIIIESSGQGTDVVNASLSYTLAANVENLNLTGTSAINGTGNILNNVITGNDAANTLAGGGGTDTLIGGLGNDTYIYDNANLTITESSTAGGGTDLVLASLSYTLDANVENLTLSGTSAINGTGNILNNTITGNTGANTLSGGGGTDVLIGLGGNDTYIYDNVNLTITESSNGGIDTVLASLDYTLAANVENLTLTGTSTLTAVGNALANTITGNDAANTLSGGGGSDKLVGGLGNDTYFYDDVKVTILESSNEGTDLVKASLSYTLAANVENLTLIGTSAINGTGNILNNVVTGNDAANTLAGGGGTDTLIGGLGNDTYIYDNVNLTITETSTAGSGTDLVLASLSYTLDANVENLTLTGSSAINGTGNSLNNTITGNTGANTLSGGGGTDVLIGLGGNDTYIYDNVNLTITESSNGGIDTVLASLDYTLAANVENLTLTGTSTLTAVGNALANTITGNDAANTLSGGGGSDKLVGGLGNDTYFYDDVKVTILESSNEGTDLVKASLSYTLAANVENLTLIGTSAINGTGNILNNVVTGNDAANTLAGGGGTDTLIGGLGNDTYIYDNVNLTITESSTAGGGTDTVLASLDYTLAANVENLTLTGTTAISATGNALNNIITGNSGANTLSGGGGTDTLMGGLGNDTYIYDNSNLTITESSNGGTDTVLASLDYTLAANVENLTLTGTTALTAVGNALANVITGNGQANTLSGGGGSDTLVGGLGNDTYVYDDARIVILESTGEGTDVVNASLSYTLAANVENLVLTGTNSINGTGNILNNVITGNDGANTLAGGGGTDTLIGGLGNDTYIYDNVNLTITESSTAGGGTDTVLASLDYTLAANVENLTLTGTTAISATGNALNNVITGNSGANTLTGGGGTDTLIGGLGNDTYIYDSVNITITETANQISSGGVDTVMASLDYTLGTYLENLTLTGTTALVGAGNVLNNIITGNGQANTLSGGGGTDTLVGGLGNDTYIYDASTITIVESSGEGTDVVNASISYTLAANVENLVLTGTNSISGTGNILNNVVTGNDGANTLAGGGGTDTLIGGLGDDTYIYDNANLTITETSTAGSGTDLVLASLDYTLAANVENLTLTGTTALVGVGNSLNNVITGNALDNTLTAGGGTDTLIGGLGNDTYIYDSADITITESTNAGTDVVNASLSYTLAANVENLVLTGTTGLVGAGNALNNIITGNSGANTLSGGGGTDTLIGGLGNDTYIYDSANITITESASGGTDTVSSTLSYTLGTNLENLTLTGTSAINGTGNSLDNIITGNSGANTLTGGGGSDTLIGGLGNDTYIYDASTITITESAGEGTDTVLASLDYTLAANVDNLTLSGTALVGKGNAIDNIITGNALDNTLSGGGGTDTLIGGLGNDTYFYDSADITIIESTNGGTDTVSASITYSLDANIENLILSGTSAINGTGNELGNNITGNSGANVLEGGAGNDTLDGGGGNDTYSFSIGDGVDVIAAGSGTDKIAFDSAVDKDNIAFFKSGSDLILSYGTGNAEKITITGGSSSIAGGIDVGALHLGKTDIDAVITAMNSYAPTTGHTIPTSVDDVKANTELMTLIHTTTSGKWA
ncbi:MAG: calcium-binding protein [bacterium]